MKAAHPARCSLAAAIVACILCASCGDACPPDPAQSPEARAIEYLVREVPRWSEENRCFSCHNNGDGARALYEAQRRGFRVPSEALRSTTDWLASPQRWDENRGDKRAGDKRLARVQFAAALRVAAAGKQAELEKAMPVAARLLVENQRPDGSWQIEAVAPVGSAVTYGRPLATWLARETLHATEAEEFRDAIARADRWLAEFTVKSVIDAAVAWWSADRLAPGTARQRREMALELLRRAQSPDGGWGPYATAPPEPFDTAVVLLALARSADRDEIGPMVARGRAFLVANQQADGSWPETTRPPGAQSYAQRLSTTGWATMALLATRPEQARE